MQFEGYIQGAYLVDCDRCGMTFYSFQTSIEEYTGLRVCRDCLDKTPVYPMPKAEKMSVPYPRPEQESIAYGNTNTTQEYGVNIFPDPFIDPINDGLWSSGTTSQQHVYSEYFSKKLNSETSNVSVAGLTIGQVYRIKVRAWTSDVIRVLIDGENTGLYLETLEIDKWFEDSVFFTAIAENITVSFENTKATDTWFDSIYIQEFNEILTYLTPSEQIENKKPKTITVDLSAQPTLYTFFTFDDDDDFNSTGFDDGIMVDILE